MIIKIKRSLFSESIAALSRESLNAASPYKDPNSSLVSELQKDTMADKYVCSIIISAYNKYASIITLDMSSEHLYPQFSAIVLSAFKNKNIQLLMDYEDIQRKLSDLVALSYYKAVGPEKRSNFSIYSSDQTAKQVAEAILNRLKLMLPAKLFTDVNFTKKLELAIATSVYYEKKEVAKTPAQPKK